MQKKSEQEKVLLRASKLHKRLLEMADKDPVAFKIIMPSFICHYSKQETQGGMQQLLRDAITASRVYNDA